MELADQQAADIEKHDGNNAFANRINRGPPRGVNKEQHNTEHPPPIERSTRTDKRICYLCGGPYPHSSKCPASGKQCSACGKLNHFARVCRSKCKEQTVQRVSDLNLAKHNTSSHDPVKN